MSEEYCRCKDCKNINEDERDGYKWYCEAYHTYEDPDDIHECRRYEER